MARALREMMGVNFTAMPTIGVNTALVIASEIGPNFSAFPSTQHFCSCLGVAPGCCHGNWLVSAAGGE